MSAPDDGDLPPVPEELGALFAAERAAGVPVAAVKVDAALGRLALQLGASGGSGGVADGSGGAGAGGAVAAAKVGVGVSKVGAIALATFAMGMGTGIAIVSAVSPAATPVAAHRAEPHASAAVTIERSRASASSAPVTTPSSLPDVELPAVPWRQAGSPWEASTQRPPSRANASSSMPRALRCARATPRAP